MADPTLAPIKILYLIGQFPAINHSYLLAEIKHLRGLGFEVSVASVSPADRPLDQLTPEERSEGAHAYYIKSVPTIEAIYLNLCEFFRQPVRYLQGLMFALSLGRSSLRRMAYQLAYFGEAVLVGRHMRRLGVSHVHASFSATVALILTRNFAATMSFGVYGFGELHDPTETLLQERIQGARFVRSISRHGCGQMMLSCDRSEWSKLIYVPLGIDAADFTPPPERDAGAGLNLLCVGRLAAEKGQGLLLEALAALRAQGHAPRLRFVGDGPDRAWLERRAHELGLSGQVEFAGWVDQDRLIALYADTDLFVLPSLAEGIPMVLMEAMAMRIPCVAPRITGIPELIEDGNEGLLFTVADGEDLAAKIRRLLESAELRSQIGQRARAKVMRDYDMAQNTGRWAAVLRERLAGAP